MWNYASKDSSSIQIIRPGQFVERFASWLHHIPGYWIAWHLQLCDLKKHVTNVGVGGSWGARSLQSEYSSHKSARVAAIQVYTSYYLANLTCMRLLYCDHLYTVNYCFLATCPTGSTTHLQSSGIWFPTTPDFPMHCNHSTLEGNWTWEDLGPGPW